MESLVHGTVPKERLPASAVQISNAGSITNIAGISYPTNEMSLSTINFAKTYSAAKTNATFAITGVTGINVGATNFNATSCFITNNSAGPRIVTTILMDGTFQNMNFTEGNTLYLTNLGHLVVFYYPGLTSTNFYWKSR